MMMGHVTSNETWASFDLNTTSGQIFIQEDWFYDWNLWPGVTAGWTYPQKKSIHTRINNQIWGAWSNRIKLGVGGTSDFARRFAGKPLPVNFDVRWDIKLPAHWRVKIWKMPTGAGPTNLHRSFVDHDNHIIELNTADIAPRGAGNSAGVGTTNFITSPHEYGHTLGSPTSFPGDEYGPGATHLADTKSMMNIGQQLRRRHLADIIRVMNKLIPGTTFNANTMVS
jgi:hypothetical protein